MRSSDLWNRSNGYLLAGAVVGASSLLRWFLAPLIGATAAPIAFIPALFLAAWFGGLGPGLFATVVSAVLEIGLFLGPADRPWTEPATYVHLLLFVFEGLLISGLSERRLRSERERVEALERERVLRTQAEDTAREIARVNRELARSNQDLQHFAYVASHDLQEPLRMVGGFLQLIARRYKGQLDADADRYINHAVDGARRMQQLVQDLLKYSRAGTQALDRKHVRMDHILERVMTDLQLAIHEAGAVITHDPLPEVFADEVKLGQVVQNLLSNSLKFRKPGEPCRVHISARSENGFWRFEVRDNGIGFAPEYSDRIFVIFQRLHGVGVYPGTGIGLAICKRIVEGHGGQIGAESVEGEGATFWFTLPAIEQSRVIASESGGPAHEEQGVRRRRKR